MAPASREMPIQLDVPIVEFPSLGRHAQQHQSIAHEVDGPHGVAHGIDESILGMKEMVRWVDDHRCVGSSGPYVGEGQIHARCRVPIGGLKYELPAAVA